MQEVEMEEQFTEAERTHSTMEDVHAQLADLNTIIRGVQTTMDDLTQKSSMPMSPTQENSESAYQRFGIQNIIRDDCIDESSQSLHETAQDSLLARQRHSAFTDSTAHTYGENDTGHVHFDAIIPGESADFDEPSQDASFAPQKDNLYGQDFYEPQTPAPPVNPFSQKGSVMKGHEMFGATQPSSIGRHMASATSTRPSPDVYNDFSSPVKQMPSSPLPGRVYEEETSPLMSSVRNLLRARSIDSPEQNGSIPRTSGVQSFDSGPRIQLQNREPRPYVSMQESQERRKSEEDASPESDSETDIDDLDDVPRKRLLKQQMEREIEKELSNIRVPKRPTSSRPVSSGSGIVEIPSTGRKGRRRSTQEQYLAQCGGRDARDSQSQQEDVIADSQSMPVEKDVATLTSGNSGVMPSWAGTTRSGSDKSNIPASPMLPGPTKQNEIQAVGSNEAQSLPKDSGSPLAEQSVPLQEVSTNRNDVRTPMASKIQIHSDADSTVPETSPAEDRLLPMGEIANISFGETQNDFTDVPGFSQIDTAFEDAIREPRSPDPPTTKKRGSRASRAPTVPDFPVAEVAEQVPTGSTEAPTEEPDALVPELPTAQSAPTANEESKSVIDAGASAHEERVQQKNDDHSKVVDEDDINTSDDRAEEAAEDRQPNPKLAKASLKTDGRKTKAESKGPAKTLKSSNNSKPIKTYTTPRQSMRITKSSSTAAASTDCSSKRVSTPGVMSTPLSSLATVSSPGTKSSPTRSCTRKPISKTTAPKEETPGPASTKPQTTRSSAMRAKNGNLPTPVPPLITKLSKRRSTAAEEPVLPTRSSQRQSMTKSTRDSSADSLAGASPTMSKLQENNAVALFENMVFAVSYVKQHGGKDNVMRLIKEQGGKILSDGFDSLFDLKPGQQLRDGDHDLTLSPAATRIGFTALIADEHSRRAKYMQALALGLPCISGRWIRTCVSRGELVNWAPYLLCAGQSSFLGNAIRSRTLSPYSAQDANFTKTIANRDKLLEGKSVLLITGKGRAAEDKRKAYVFLTRALGPAQLEQVVGYGQARKRLLDTEGQDAAWDLLYVDNNIAAAEAAVFGSGPSSSGSSRKRKRGPAASDDVATPAPKKIRIISDEEVIQSLILGELLD
jgi:hypothetical protein